MDYRVLGRTGLSVSAIGFGCGNTGGLLVRGEASAQRRAVAAAIAGGINYFDTAAQYGDGRSEESLGRTLRDLSATVFVGTKLRLNRDEVADAPAIVRQRLEEGLARLGRKRVDVVTLHTRVGPAPGELDPADVIGPVADAMRGTVAAGLAGATGFTGLGDTAALYVVATSGRYDVMQCYYNLLNQSASVPGSPDGLAQDFAGLADVATAHGTAAIGIRCLAGGALASAEHRHELAGGVGRPMADGEEYEDDVRRAAVYRARLEEFGASGLGELALRFALANHSLSCVLAGFSDEAHVQEALRVAELGPLAGSALDALRSH